MKKETGYIYVMTNKAYKEQSKIGYATNISNRRQTLSSGLQDPYEVYASYKVYGGVMDKKLHRIIDIINPKKRVKSDRENEWYKITPEIAYQILENIAIITNTEKNLIDYSKGEKFSLSAIGIVNGAILTFRDTKEKCEVIDNKTVKYKNKKYSLSTLALKLLKETKKKNWKAADGKLHFKYKGQYLVDIWREKQ